MFNKWMYSIITVAGFCKYLYLNNLQNNCLKSSNDDIKILKMLFFFSNGLTYFS